MRPMVTWEQIMAQRRRPHRSGRLPKGVLLQKWKERNESAQQAAVNESTGSIAPKDKTMAIKAQESTFTPIDEGIYKAMFSGWEEAPDKGFGPGIKVIWTLSDERKADSDPLDVWHFFSQKLTPKSVFWNVLKGCGQIPVMFDERELDGWLDPCVGVEANIVIKHEDKGNGPRAKVTDVLPLKAAKK